MIPNILNVRKQGAGHIAHTVRGFNFEDCPRFKDVKKGGFFGRPSPEFIEYDYRECMKCNEQCSARKSKIECKNHRIIAISHARLFLSNDIENLFDDILYFNCEEEKVQRKYLIIDEKIDMCDIPSIRVKDFNKLKELVQDRFNQYESVFLRIEDFINSLDYPSNLNGSIIKQSKVFIENGDFQFDGELLKSLYKNTSIERDKYETLFKLGKILNSKNITTGIHYNQYVKSKDIDKEREIFAYKYLNLAEYNRNFEKTIILDATAYIDDDYIQSDVILCENIVNSKREINVFIPKWDSNSSRYKLNINTDINIQNIVKECINIFNLKKKRHLLLCIMN